jgi:hypothetical protein
MKKSFKKTQPATASASPATTSPIAQAVAADSGTPLTDDQMQRLAQSFHDISVAIGQIRLDAIKGGAALNDPGIVQLQGSVFSLKNVSDNFALQSARLTLQNADQALKQITTATEAANQALDKLAKIDKTIQIASTVIVLAGAIESRDLSQIAAAAKSVVSVCGVSVA